MSRAIDITGQRFGRLTVVGRDYQITTGNTPWICKCDCGTTKTIRRDKLVYGETRSCGCYRKEVHTTHGNTKNMEYSREYVSWKAMINRTNKKRGDLYRNYKARGITVCDRWRESFESFLEDMGLAPSEKHTVDRIDNDGSYSPENCQWADRKTQARNKRSNRLIDYRGETRCLTEWAEIIGVRPGALFWRLDHGWSVDRAFATPIGEKSKHGE